MTVSPLCAYDGFPAAAPLFGPWPAGKVLQEAYTPPARVWVTADASRSLGHSGWRDVPEVPCVHCGTPTRWTVLVAVQQSFPTIGEMALRPVSVAVCPTCAQARDAAWAGGGR